ncbi:hypothetical protein M569_00693, partial [Genlisea aurea]
MSVVGFDIGNDNCVIAVANQRGVDVLLNDESKRETPAVVSFGDKQRFMGSSGAASTTMHPKSTISQIKRLITLSYRDPSVQNELQLLPFETSEGADGGILIHLRYLGQRHIFTPVQVLAMLLGYLKELTEKNLGMEIASCVISIPSYFTDSQRSSYLYAAEIVGLSPLRLMHDCTAIALGYGIYKTEYPRGGEANVVFVDIGHCDTQVAVVSFRHGGLKVLAHAFDSKLGGRDFDEVLFRYFASQFRDQYKIDVYSSSRASVRLRASCEKLKKVLSANTEAQFNIECLIEEKDVQGCIKRDEFENLASGLVEKIDFACRRALDESGLTFERIHGVELVGSGSRVPAITNMLHSLFGKEPSRTLNASECVARGCAVQCAMLSPTYRLKEYEIEDRFPFSFSVSLSSDDEVSVCSVGDRAFFPKGTTFPRSKVLKLQRNDVFSMEIFYSNQNELPLGVSTRISSFKIGPFRVSSDEKANIKIKVQLNLNGIVAVNAVSLVDDHLDDSLKSSTTETLPENLSQSNHDSFGKACVPSLMGHGMRRLKAVRRQDVFINETTYCGMTKEELSQARSKEHDLAQQDKNMERTKEKKNALEAYVYETRNKLMDTYRGFASASEKEGISDKLQQTEEWLYEEGEDESETIYTKKLEDLKELVDPIEHRYKEEDLRQLAGRNLSNSIKEYQSAAGTLPASERDFVLGECNRVEEWLQQRMQLQDSLAKNANPAVWSGEINEKAKALDE